MRSVKRRYIPVLNWSYCGKDGFVTPLFLCQNKALVARVLRKVRPPGIVDSLWLVDLDQKQELALDFAVSRTVTPHRAETNPTRPKTITIHCVVKDGFLLSASKSKSVAENVLLLTKGEIFKFRSLAPNFGDFAYRVSEKLNQLEGW